MNETSTDHCICLYDKILTPQAQTSGREGSTPIDVYNSYLQRDVDIDTLCSLSADIMNFVETHELEGVEPNFLKWCVWWRYEDQNLFGIHLISTIPRLMFGTPLFEYFEEVYPEYKFTY